MSKITFYYRRIITINLMAVILCGYSFSQSLDPNPLLTIAMNHLAKAQANSNKTSYPRSTNTDGTIKRVGATDWTSGFFPGSLWLMYENTKDDTWRTRAEQWTAGLESQKNNTSTHDVGFILYSSFGAGYRLTGNETYKAILLQGAKSLSTRFNAVVGSIKSWDNNPQYTFPVNIDNMMNLEILFWATRVSGDSSYYNIAVKHALTTMVNHFRPDNSSYHVVDYNPVNGSVISKGTYQGLNDLSDWARGQAWGLYGFTMCYRETKDVRFLDMAKKIADFYITHPNMPSDFIPFWDFDAFDYRDASSASIAASALLELSQYVPENKTLYYNFSLNILTTISSPAYTAAVGTNNNFLLKHSVGNKPKNTEVDKPLNFTDYYCIEALLRHKKPSPIVSAISGDGQVTLKWNIATGATSYNIKRSVIKGGPYTIIDSNITNTVYVNSGLQSGQTYYYIVTSCNATGEGTSSGEVNGASTSQQPSQFSLITSVNGSGSIIKNPDQIFYTNGTNVSLTAMPSPSQQFTGWSGAASGTANPITIVMDNNKSIIATFLPFQYNLTVIINGNGTVLKSPDQDLFDSGAVVSLTPSPMAGQQFTGWSGSANGTSNPLIFAMDATKTITANFAQASPLITNITSRTGRIYTLAQLSAGTTVYSDRNYVATSVPSFITNAPFIKTPNDDKGNKSTNEFSFNLTQNATVYIAYDPRSTTLPAWLNNWQKLTSQIGVNDPKNNYMQLYSKDFASGKVTLGGNLAIPAAGASSNYFVAAKIVNAPVYRFALDNATSNDSKLANTQNDINLIKVFPNPYSGNRLFIKAFNLQKREAVTITLQDLLGRNIMVANFNTNINGELIAELPLGKNINKGLYIIKASYKVGFNLIKLIIN